MDNLKEKALEISKRYPFSPFQTSAAAVNEKSASGISACENHLDIDFMKLLEQGAYFDTNKIPL